MKRRVLRLEGAEAVQDRHGVPRIQAGSAEDAFRAWGYLQARDRFFQMDLLRRSSAGRLAELYGPRALEADRASRLLHMEPVASEVLARAAPGEAALLRAYAEGVNALLAARRVPPLEYLLLRARPEPWRPKDCALVLLALYRQLALDLEGKRTEHGLAAALPPGVARFFTPRGDEFSDPAGADPEIPVAELRELMARCAGVSATPLVPRATPIVPGSNCWAMAGHKTAAGVPLVANDMHLALAVPNAWHRVELAYGGSRVTGIAVPGAPVIVSGSNGVLAWGVTNLPGDVTELVEVEGAPLRRREERIRVRGRADEVLAVDDSPRGPVLPQPAGGRRVALQWAALWPGGAHFGLMRLAGARTLDEAVQIAREGGVPPLNFHFAHRDEGIAWTVSGPIPRRDGCVLAHGEFLPPASLPCRVNPPEGFLVTANDPVPAGAGGAKPGWNHRGAYRRHRIAQRLAARDRWTEAGTLELQRDTRTAFYDFYHALALEAAGSAGHWPPALRGDVEAALRAWDGHAAPRSRGMPLLAVFHRALAARLLSWYLRPCAVADPEFRYTWRNPEAPLRRLLRERPAGLVPEPERWPHWDACIAGTLREAATALRERARRPLAGLCWGDFLRVEVRHPMGGTPLTRWLNLPPLPAEGCEESVAAFGVARGPTQRSVVAPGREQHGLFQMPGGQSGSPLSRHYGDHHRAWIAGRSFPFGAG